jgi:predicted nucleotidyltransferase
MAESKPPQAVMEYSRHLKRRYGNLQKVYLFGSYAKGIAHEDSDMDIAAVFEEVEDNFNLQVELMKIRRQYDTRIEPHVFRSGDFERSNPLAAEILDSGIEIS